MKERAKESRGRHVEGLIEDQKRIGNQDLDKKSAKIVSQVFVFQGR